MKKKEEQILRKGKALIGNLQLVIDGINAVRKVGISLTEEEVEGIAKNKELVELNEKIGNKTNELINTIKGQPIDTPQGMRVVPREN